MYFRKLSELIRIDGQLQFLPTEKDCSEMRTFIPSIPSDYEQYVKRYGDGVLCDFLYLFIPGSPDRNSDFLSRSGTELASFKKLSIEFPECFDGYNFYDGARGLCPFGATYGGHVLFWDIVGEDTDRWNLVIYDHSLENLMFAGGICEFIFRVSRGQYLCSLFHKDSLRRNPLPFVPS